MSNAFRASLALTLAVVLLGTTLLAGAASGEATASRACNIAGQERSFNTSYVTSLKVFGGLSCFKGKQIIRAFHRCRINNGGADGRCPNRILRYRCAEGRRTGVPDVQYNGRVACARGTKKVVSTYTQNV